jgi:hypothetical protein
MSMVQEFQHVLQPLWALRWNLKGQVHDLELVS